MKRLASGFAAAVMAVAAVAAAQETPAKTPTQTRLDKLVNDALPYCADAKTSQRDLPFKLPAGFVGKVVDVASKSYVCEGQYVVVTTPTNGFFIGTVWPLIEQTGTVEEKLQAFAWQNLQQNLTPVVDRTARTRDGLFDVTLFQTTERGRVPLEGVIDPEGKVFFVGHFQPMADDPRAVRMKAFDTAMANAPTRGPAKSDVTVIEFSDFQCPSCAHASHYLDPILKKHGERVRYIRYDLPLMTHHPWALSASIAGRAIYRQKPELFWTYKQAVYDNQEKLHTFTFDDWARGFASDHDLDMTKYDADVNSEAIRNDILKGIGTAFTWDIRSTPTYMVNGVVVEAGEEGEKLATYIDGLLK